MRVWGRKHTRNHPMLSQATDREVLHTADYMFGCRQTANSPGRGHRKETWRVLGKGRCVTVLSEFLIFSNKLVGQAIVKNTTTFYTKPCTHTHRHTELLTRTASTKPAPLT